MANGSGVVCHHEWGTLKKAIVGISPIQDFVIPVWYDGLDFMPPRFMALSKEHGGQKLCTVDPSFAQALQDEVDHFAGLLTTYGVEVLRPTPLQPPESTYLTPHAEGAQIFPRDDILVIGEQVIELNLKIQWRRREKFGLRHALATSGAASWTAMPMASPPSSRGGEDENPANRFLSGGDVLLNGYEVYAGNSGLASNRNGIAWLQNQLGSQYTVHEIPIHREALHLDVCMMLVGPKTGLICRPWVHLDPLPPSLEAFDWIEVTEDEAALLGTNVCVLKEGTVMMSDQQWDVGERLKAKLEKNLDLLWIDYSNVIELGGGLRCCHHPLVRESVLS